MRSTATASDQTLMMASTMAMNFANGPMVRHMESRSNDMTGSAAWTTRSCTESSTGSDIGFSLLMGGTSGPEILLEPQRLDHPDGGRVSLGVGAGDPLAVGDG